MAQRRGFSAMDPEKHRRVASMGGRKQGMANNPGNFANNRERARIAGRKGGLNKKPREVLNECGCGHCRSDHAEPPKSACRVIGCDCLCFDGMA